MSKKTSKPFTPPQSGDLASKVAALRAKGQSIKAIAKSLHVSDHTVAKLVKEIGIGKPAQKPAPAKTAPKKPETKTAAQPKAKPAVKKTQAKIAAPRKADAAKGKSVPAQGVIVVKITRTALLKAAFDEFIDKLDSIFSD